jgi:protein-tyrosine phosphatase
MLDLVVPSVDQLRRAVNAIEAMPRPTLVFCALGRSRSAISVAAWLLATRRAATVDEALAHIRSRRPQVYLHSGHRERLEDWAALQ